MVKFCPKCGSIMVPTKRGDKVYLKCNKCGYETTEKEKKYEMRYQVESTKRVATAVASEAKETKLTPEEREMLSEYYEIFLEEFERESTETEE